MENRSLKQELMDEGASQTEASRLSELAQNLPKLRLLPSPSPSLAFRKRQLTRRLNWRRISVFVRYSATAMAAVLIGVVVTSGAQSALPGDPLYGLKLQSETLAAHFQPQMHDQIMMNRADEISQLVASHRNVRLIDATLNSYNLAVELDPSGSYSARDYCASMLRSAAQHSDGATKAKIMESLSRISVDQS
jgi:hypothetical protein